MKLIAILIILVNCTSVVNGEIGFCYCHSCSENEGDCDSNEECQDGLACGSNNCPASLSLDFEVDCCYQPSVGHEEFCTTENPCGGNEGHCDSHDECHKNHFCGYKNCPASFDANDNCCTKHELIKSPNFPLFYPLANNGSCWINHYITISFFSCKTYFKF